MNISADHAGNAEVGCFVDHDIELLNSVYFRWDGIDHVLLEDDLCMQIFTMPLSKRGWVVQERLLSPRVLHFGRDQIYWECKEMSFASEIFPGGLGYSESSIDKVLFNIQLTSHNPGVEDWSKVVLQYSKCSLSFPVKDKFIAIGAIAERFAKLYNTGYVAGSFGSVMDLPKALLWRVARSDEHSASIWSGEYRAPSWSWMNIDGPVDISDVGYFGWSMAWLVSDEEISPFDPSYNYTRVTDLQIELVNPANKFGPLKSARIVLQGLLFSDECLKDLEQWWKERKWITSIMDSQTFEFDEEMLMIFPIGRTDHSIHGLFLKQEDSLAEQTYSRLGYFRIEDPYPSPPWDELKTGGILGAEKTINLI